MLVTMSVTMSVIIFKKRKIMNDIKLTSDKIGKKEVKKLRQKLLKDFLHTFPLDSLQGMTLEQYTNFNKDGSFCYWLESRTYELGSIWVAHHINLVSMNIVLRPIFTTQSLSAMKNMLGMQDIISLQLKKLST